MDHSIDEARVGDLEDEVGGEMPRQLSPELRRCLGVLIEKAYTTPEYYPLTLKGATTGCNQKSNRSPVVNYTEDDVFSSMDQLRELGLVTVIYPGGRPGGAFSASAPQEKTVQ